MAVSQYERVPTQKIKKNHYKREIDKGEMPKRLQVAVMLFYYIFTDILTLVFTILLLITGWRALNTLEITYNHWNLRRTNSEEEKHFLETMIKDQSMFI